MIRERAKRSIVWKMSDPEFDTLVKTSRSIGDICLKLGGRKAGGIFTNIKNRIEKMALDTSHFVDGRIGHNSPVHISQDEFIRRLDSGVTMDAVWMKKKIIEFSLLPYKCISCNLGREWNGKPLILHLDHADGDFSNNKLSNLRFLCPNCHTQTETYSRRKSSLKW